MQTRAVLAAPSCTQTGASPALVRGAVLFSDAFTQMLVITLVNAFVMSSASRNAALPAAAIGSSAAGVVTVSLGAAELNGDLDTDAGELIRRADLALYAAKHAGRNRVMLAADAAPREPLTSS